MDVGYRDFVFNRPNDYPYSFNSTSEIFRFLGAAEFNFNNIRNLRVERGRPEVNQTTVITTANISAPTIAANDLEIFEVRFTSTEPFLRYAKYQMNFEYSKKYQIRLNVEPSGTLGQRHILGGILNAYKFDRQTNDLFETPVTIEAFGTGQTSTIYLDSDGAQQTATTEWSATTGPNTPAILYQKLASATLILSHGPVTGAGNTASIRLKAQDFGLTFKVAFRDGLTQAGTSKYALIGSTTTAMFKGVNTGRHINSSVRINTLESNRPYAIGKDQLAANDTDLYTSVSFDVQLTRQSAYGLNAIETVSFPHHLYFLESSMLGTVAGGQVLPTFLNNYLSAFGAGASFTGISKTGVEAPVTDTPGINSLLA